MALLGKQGFMHSTMMKTAAKRSGSGALLALLGAGLLSLAAAPARAGEALAVVLEPKVEGPLSKEEQARLELSVTDALRGAQLQVVPTPDRQAIEEGEPELKGCRTDECQDRIGRLLSAQTVLAQTWQLERAAGDAPQRGKKASKPEEGKKGRFRFTVAVFNVTVGAVGAKEEAACASCTVDEAATALGELVKKAVLLEAARPRGKIEVASTPSADVLVDGRKLGFTPYKREAYAGKHDVTVARTGYRSHHESVTVEEGKKAQITVTLKQGADKQVREIRTARPRWRLALGGAAVAGGAVLLGFGISALAVNGRCVQEPMAPALVCDEVYRTGGVGAGLLVAGLALGAGGAVLLALPGEKKLIEVHTAALGSGFGLRLAGTF